MTRYLYGASTADFAATVIGITTTVDGAVDNLVQVTPGAVFDVYDAPVGAQVTDLLGVPSPDLSEGSAVTQVTALANGTIPFYGPDGEVGTLYLQVDDGLGGFLWYPLNPSKLADVVADIQAQVTVLGESGSGFSGSYTDLTNIPGTFAPSPHTQPVSSISDATATGRAVVTAVDGQAARAAIGAGTGNGTSNLTIGATATTAAAGNHTHNAGSLVFAPTGALTATDVQGAIVQAAASGGGGTITGSSTILVWRYASGAYPAQPATKPTGASLMFSVGPTQPMTIPSWVGVGASDVVLFFDAAPLT